MEFCAQQYTDEVDKLQNPDTKNSNALSINSKDSLESMKEKIAIIKGMY